MDEKTRAGFLEVARGMPMPRTMDDVDQYLWRPFWHHLNGARGMFCVTDPRYEKSFCPKPQTFDGLCHLFGLLETNNIGLIQNIGSSRGARYTFTVSPDTNFTSYLVSFINTGDVGTNTEAMRQSLRYMIDYRNGFDCMCYLHENFDRLDTPKGREPIRAHLLFRLADIPKFKQTGQFVTGLSDAEIQAKVDGLVATTRGPDFAVLHELAMNNYLTAAVCLHKMAVIEFGGGGDNKAKLKDFLSFLQDELAFFPFREMLVAFSYLTQRPRPAFFDPVQANSARILARLSAMAWDMSHVRRILDHSASSSRHHETTPFPIPYFITFDQSFAAFRNLLQVKAIVYFDKPNRADVIHSFDWVGAMEAVLGPDAEGYFGEQAFMDRQKRRPPEESDWKPMLAAHLDRLKTQLTVILAAR